MPDPRYLPPVAAGVGLWRLVSGRIRLPGDRVGRFLTTENGEVHTVFREIRVASSRSVTTEDMTVLRVRFRFARFSHPVNRILSLLPVPAIIGMPGFRGKIWTFCRDSGYSQGIYQFESLEQAEEYCQSPVMVVLEKRSVPGSMSKEIHSGTRIEDFLEERGMGVE